MIHQNLSLSSSSLSLLLSSLALSLYKSLLSSLSVRSSKSISLFSFLSSLLFIIIICTAPSFTKASDNCPQICDSQMILYNYEEDNQCNASCKMTQCQNGCKNASQISLDVHMNRSCEEICNKANPGWKYCMRGCKQYMNNLCNIIISQIKPFAPHLRANSSTNTSLIIEWYININWNLVYNIQYKLESISSNWTNYKTITPIRNNFLLIKNLKPYTEYRFRVLFKIMDHCPIIYSKPSVKLTTAPSAPSPPPNITSLEAFSHRIKVTWRPPEFPTGRILAYFLYLYEHYNDGRRVKEIESKINLTSSIRYNQSNPLHYTFSNLRSNTLYTIGVSTLNNFGEGPQVKLNITTPLDNELNNAEIIKPLLIIASNRRIMNQSIDMSRDHGILYTDNRANITSIDIHYAKRLIVFANSYGFISSISFDSKDKLPVSLSSLLSSSSSIIFSSHHSSKPPITRPPMKPKLSASIGAYKFVTKSVTKFPIKKISVDWINDKVYLLLKYGISRCDLNGNHLEEVIGGLDDRAKDVHVDPYNGYLYWSIEDILQGGLYRISLNLQSDQQEIRRFLKNTNITIFTIDYIAKKLYFPENNTIFSTTLDGNNLTDIRPNVAQPDLINVTSLVNLENTFYWTIGSYLYKEEYHKDTNIYYHNSFYHDNHLVSLAIIHPDLQPIPSSRVYPTRKISFHPYNFLWIFITSSMIVIAMLCILKKVKNNHKEEKESLKDSERSERNLISLPQLPKHPHEDNRLYLSGDLAFDSELSEIPHVTKEQIKYAKFLGSGAFGEVFEGSVCNLIPSLGEVKVAIKTLRKGSTEQEKADFIKEAKMMGIFKHPHILQLLGICLDPENNSILLELMEGGDLLSYLRSMRPIGTKPSSLTMDDLLSICVDVARGCQYLEEMHFVHRDLAARNCLVSSYSRKDRVVKIGDFGLARDIYKNDYYRKEGEGLLPVRWMAPESLVDGVFTTQSDIWSFGVLLWEVMTLGQQPYPARNNQEVLNYVRSGGTPDKPVNCLVQLYSLMRECWNYDPNFRPTFLTCLQFLVELRDTMSSTDTLITSISNQSYYMNVGLRDTMSSTDTLITSISNQSYYNTSYYMQF